MLSLKFLLIRCYFHVIYWVLVFSFPLSSAVNSSPPPFHKITCILTPDSNFELMGWMKGHPLALPSSPKSKINLLWWKDQAFWLLILHVLNRTFLSACCACLGSVPSTQSFTSLSETSKLWVNSSRANVNFNKYHFQSNIYHAFQA